MTLAAVEEGDNVLIGRVDQAPADWIVAIVAAAPPSGDELVVAHNVVRNGTSNPALEIVRRGQVRAIAKHAAAIEQARTRFTALLRDPLVALGAAERALTQARNELRRAVERGLP